MANGIIISAERIINGTGDLEKSLQLIQKASDAGLTITELTIDPLRTDWDSPIEEGHFRSGCGPIEAISVANRMVQQAESDLVIIHGRDYLKSEYTREERHKLMDIYEDGISLPEAYTMLTRHFCEQQGISEQAFISIRDMIFDNLLKTAEEHGITPPSDKWFTPLTALFRGVDCANPIVDFEGILIICHPEHLNTLSSVSNPVEICAAGIGIAEQDGPHYVQNLAKYHALEKALHYAEVQSGQDIKALIQSTDTLLDAYTCYPVVPLALLNISGAATSFESLQQFLANKPLTQTGGMNLARAPWNNPAMNGLIAMYEQLQKIRTTGIVHGNGGLGYKQGIALLKAF